MRCRFIDFPIPVDIEVYEKAIGCMLDKMVEWPGVKAICQIGGISTPGISDLDMVVIFDDGITCKLNPRQYLSKIERYLFAHGLYGASVTHFREAQNYSYFHNYELLWGSDFLIHEEKIDSDQERILKIQIALEYLLKMYINLVIQRVYKVYKTRGFFLHIKAVLYDLDFLGVSSGRLLELTKALIDIRNNWFKVQPLHETLKKLFDTFFESLVEFLEHAINEQGFYLPQQEHYVFEHIIKLKHGPKIQYQRNGIVLPKIFSIIGRRYFNLQNRFGGFLFELPIITHSIPVILEERFNHIKDMKKYNLQKLSYFDPLTSSLDVL